jgi:hypothetical protein
LAAALQGEKEQANRNQVEIARLQAELQKRERQPDVPRTPVTDSGGGTIYTAQTSGVLTWSGRMKKGDVVVINDRRPSIGRLYGNPLPGVPVQVTVTPGDVALEEPPSASNGWRRMVLRSGRSHDHEVKIEWSVIGRSQ